MFSCVVYKNEIYATHCETRAVSSKQGRRKRLNYAYTEVKKFGFLKQSKKALALSGDRGFKAENKDFIKSKAKEAELSVRNFF